jgi:hypothetical protein
MTMFMCHPELVSGSIYQPQPVVYAARWTLKQVQGDGCVRGLA